MVDVPEEVREIDKQHVTFCAVLLVVPCKLLFQARYGKVGSAPLDVGGATRRERRPDRRCQRVAVKRLMHDAFRVMHGRDMPKLAPLEYVKLNEAAMQS